MTYAQYAADIESSVELLRTIAAVLDIRAVFPQVSEIANKVLAHDLLTMMFHDRGHILVEAASTDTRLMAEARNVFTAFIRWMSPTPMNPRAVSIRMPMPAPKYPP